MICPDCSQPLVPALLSFNAREDLRRAIRQPPKRRRKADASLTGPKPEASLLRIGLDVCCADCFWWRVALLIGYCVL